MIHEIVQPAFATCTMLAAPVGLSSFDATPELSSVELAGYTIWLLGFLWGCLADAQKVRFEKQCQQAKRKAKFASTDANGAAWEPPVLGLRPYAGWGYFCWGRCRHPNYFGEWMAWNGIVLAAVPSLVRHPAPPLVSVGMALASLFTSRYMYDCLLYGSGAEPSEYYSVQKRKAYRDYQKSTRVFWPFELPGRDHGRRADWPAVPVKSKAAAAPANEKKKTPPKVATKAKAAASS